MGGRGSGMEKREMADRREREAGTKMETQDGRAFVVPKFYTATHGVVKRRRQRRERHYREKLRQRITRIRHKGEKRRIHYRRNVDATTRGCIKSVALPPSRAARISFAYK